MTTPPNDDGADATPADAEARVELGKQPAPAFDPYRYGRPDHPVPPEYAPPGYVPDQPAVPPPPGVYPNAPYGQAPYGQAPYGQAPYGQAPYGQARYGQAPYGRPYPPPPGGATGGNTGSNGKAIASMVLGIASIALCWLSFLALLVIVPALVLGIIGLNESKPRGGTGRSMAVAGIACAVVAAVLATLLTIFVFRAADKCGGVDNSNAPGFERCVQDNFFSSGRF